MRGNFGLKLQNSPTYMLHYVVMQMRKTNREKGYSNDKCFKLMHVTFYRWPDWLCREVGKKWTSNRLQANLRKVANEIKVIKTNRCYCNRAYRWLTRKAKALFQFCKNSRFIYLQHWSISDCKHDPHGACAFWVGKNSDSNAQFHVITPATDDLFTDWWPVINKQISKKTYKQKKMIVIFSCEVFFQNRWHRKGLKRPSNCKL